MTVIAACGRAVVHVAKHLGHHIKRSVIHAATHRRGALQWTSPNPHRIWQHAEIVRAVTWTVSVWTVKHVSIVVLSVLAFWQWQDLVGSCAPLRDHAPPFQYELFGPPVAHPSGDYGQGMVPMMPDVNGKPARLPRSFGG